MLWNNTATVQGILPQIDFLCSTTSATYSIADKTLSVNSWQDFIVSEVLDSMDEWDFQGDKSYHNLVADQQAYAWPTEILKIKRVEVDYDGDGGYTPADAFDAATYDGSIATSAEINDIFPTSNPKYDAYGNSAFLYPVPSSAVNSGLIFWFTDNVTDFTATAALNTAEPTFERPFHRILSLGASLDFATKHEMSDLITFCRKELYGSKELGGGLISKMRKFYGTRTADKILQLKSQYYDENYR